MLAAARHAAILALVRDKGTIRVAAVAPMLDVSEITIRRDIDSLVYEGLLERVYGGAKMPAALSADEPGFERQEAEKEAIAREALSLVRPGAAIALSAGTTTLRLAKLLSTMPGITVVTNSVQIASVFYPSGTGIGSTTHVILTGGERTPSDALVGPTAISAIRQFHLDTLFLGVHGMDEHAGFTTPNIHEAETNRAFLEAAGRVVVLADHTKWGTVGMSAIAPLNAASVLITDDGLTQSARDLLRDQVAELRVAALRDKD
ncbi:MAG TPA: DeoR family transcriptional regulator [Microbacteriaceae bacterium]|nr:DeoR family transcriptional regulator [Microbacteriaceae bacterium]